jgi:uncharacterized repeat protein (TIGR01451 family)
MKKLLLLLGICAIFNTKSSAQTVNIPDPNFVNFLTISFPGCMTGSLMDTTCPMIVGANFMSLNSWGITNLTGIQYFDNLKTLDISNNSITVIPPLPATLLEFTCEDVPVSTLPTLPLGLTKLKLKNNPISSLPTLPSTLIELTCYNLSLTSLPALPASLYFLDVQFNDITVLPALPTSLGSLFVKANLLTALPTLPTTLTHLDIASNNISSLPALLPPSLTFLDVTNNNLTSLPATVPNTLFTFHCGSNDISTLPPVIGCTGLYTFSCGGNNITSIPPLPAGLFSFYCQDNLLTTLPELPSSLYFLFCQGNLLTTLDTLSPGLMVMNCSNNSISCFPELPVGTGYSYTLFPNPATCLPNYGAWMNPTLLGYPLCVFGDPLINPAGCANGSGIYGSAFEDVDNNCALTGPDDAVPNIPFKLYDLGGVLLQQGYSTYTGGYYFNPGIGSYELRLDTAAIPFLDHTCGSISQLTTLTASTPVLYDLDFDLECNGNIDLGVESVTTIGSVFPGQDHFVSVVAGDLSQWYDFNCAAGQSGQILVTVNGPVTYLAPIAGAATPTVAGNVYTYNVSDYGTFDINTQIGLQFTTDTTAISFDTVCVTVVVTGTGTDVDLANNNYSFCYTVNNSYDPNMKEVWPIDVEVGYNDFFTYTIHFQNTGTAPALNIVLVDTLDANLDLSTFEMIGYSHTNQVTLVGNRLIIDYPNINLVDSTTDYYGSMGYFQYRIKPITGLAIGAQIENTAHIFFDFNPAIVTNTTVNTVLTPTGLYEMEIGNKFSFYPNPLNNQATLISANPSGESRILTITDALGHVMVNQNVGSAESITINAGQLLQGIYFFLLEGSDQSYARGTFMIQR